MLTSDEIASLYTKDENLSKNKCGYILFFRICCYSVVSKSLAIQRFWAHYLKNIIVWMPTISVDDWIGCKSITFMDESKCAYMC